LKVLYFYISDGNLHSGVSRKVNSEVNALKTLDTDITLFETCITKKENNLPVYLGFLKPLAIVARGFEIRRDLRHCINSLDDQDILYIRSGVLPLPVYPINFFKRFRLCKIVSEHQTIEIDGALQGKRYLDYLNEVAFGRFIREQFDGVVGVTDEIKRHQIRRVKNRSIPNLIMGNGFDVQSVVMREVPQYCGDNLQILCVASIGRWHGFDRLLRGLAAYSGRPKVILHIAGDGAERPHLQKLAGDLGITDRVVFHGFTTGKALDVLFDQCHIAVGSLGLHRIGLKEASILKAREYCARGIPFIYGISDPDFPPDFPYILHLPADESPIDIEQVLAFAREICADLGHPEKMRRYAEEHLDWSVKMKSLKGFLETLVGENRPEGIPEPSVAPLAATGLKVPEGTTLPNAGQEDMLSGMSRERGH
jgi:glycosyltransferase involved in cell wall biosynthesis